MKKIAFLLLSAVVFTACGPNPSLNPSDEQVSEGTILEESEMDIAGVTGVDFYDQAVSWATEEVTSAHQEYYAARISDASTDLSDRLSFWAVGTVRNGPYKDQTLVVTEERCEGPCPASYYRYAVDEASSTWTLLTPYSMELDAGMAGGPATAQDDSIQIPDLEVPETLALYENDNTLLLDRYNGRDANFYGDNENPSSFYEETSFTDTSFSTYYTTGTTSCVYGVTPDGIMARYLVMPNVFTYTAPGKDNPYVVPQLSQTFDGREYTLSAGRCGLMFSCLEVASATAAEAADLNPVATMDGRSVYMLGSIGEEPSDDAEPSLLSKVYQAYNSYSMGLQYREPPQTPISIQEFVEARNVVFFQMDSGLYALAYDSEYAPTAECGKPVIYLYPETAQEVSVKVNGIEFSKTIPEHGVEGWTVWASPTGVLKNLADGLEYPYLFWEGSAGTTIPLGEGWTLAKKDIAQKLPVALQGMGLNKQESKDFMEFWLPKLLAEKTPYVRFNFVGTATMNAVAPLELTPAPDTLLRIFMVYEGTAKAGLSMPTYAAPVRKGFTVIEWGGSLY